MSSKITLSQFKGCLAGLLVGDCLGFPYENEGSRYKPLEHIQLDLDNFKSTKTRRRRQYTDDTSMTITMSRYLLEVDGKEPHDYRKLAKMFYDAYINEPLERSYGSHVHTVFSKLNSTNFVDAFKPASDQFNGQGSLGNGSGMRVAPIVLYTILDPDSHRLTDMTINVSRITHTHPVGVAGGIFQALANRLALLQGKDVQQNNEDISPLEFLDTFEKEFVKETQDREETKNGYKIYVERIGTIRKFIQGGVASWSLQEVRDQLGVKVTSAESIPTGLFCFLAAFEDIPYLKTDNQFQRTVQLATALGGDADTIGAMAGAIAGAYLGFSSIETNFVENCEDFEGVLGLAESLYKNYENDFINIRTLEIK